ncbi:hypothetical protein OS493_012578 [Desmophyllum pertusum]|uniref:Uncharacterized protein n=1 Tax=Desmophyllum pertusum TaxID=174260 RepID=A0A9X0D018_9CNID|nr:hypothetical protein OS493_012578 [Desmophyllum pertusum]
MEEATKLIALDHNHNASRKQAKVQSGEREGELRFRIAWSKVTKRYDAEPVLEKKESQLPQKWWEIPLSTRRV